MIKTSKKSNFYKNKKLFTMKDIDINKILVCKEEPYGNIGAFKYFIGYDDNDKIRPLFIKLPQIIDSVTHFKDRGFRVRRKVT